MFADTIIATLRRRIVGVVLRRRLYHLPIGVIGHCPSA